MWREGCVGKFYMFFDLNQNLGSSRIAILIMKIYLNVKAVRKGRCIYCGNLLKKFD